MKISVSDNLIDANEQVLVIRFMGAIVPVSSTGQRLPITDFARTTKANLCLGAD